MQVKLLGYSKVDFTSDRGDRIEGSNLYISFNENHVVGQKCDRVYVKAGIELPEQLKIGDTLNLFFNNKGKVEAISK